MYPFVVCSTLSTANCMHCTDTDSAGHSTCLRCADSHTLSDDGLECIRKWRHLLTMMENTWRTYSHLWCGISIIGYFAHVHYQSVWRIQYGTDLFTHFIIYSCTHFLMYSFTHFVWFTACSTHTDNCVHCHDFGAQCSGCVSPYKMAPEGLFCGRKFSLSCKILSTNTAYNH